MLPAGARPIRVLQISDLHLTPGATRRQRWVAGLAALEPDLVIDTGDNLAHREAVPFVLRSLGRLLDRPGVYVWGSNDYYAPTFKNPLGYLTGPSRKAAPGQDRAALAGPRPRVRGARLGRPDPHPADAGDQGRAARVPRHRRRPPQPGPLRRGRRTGRPRPRSTSRSA